MNLPGLLLIAAYLVTLVAITRPLGVYLTRVFGDEGTYRWHQA